MNAIVADKVLVELEAKVSNYNRDVNQASQNFDNRMRQIGNSANRTERIVKASTDAMSRQALSLGRAFTGALAGGVFAGGAAGLVTGVRNLVSNMNDLAVTAERVGQSVEDLQRLRYAFEQIGVSSGQTDTAMQRFARRVGEAANGTGVLRSVLEANNVQLRNQDGSMRRQIDILRDYAELIKNAGSEQERLVLANRAFDVEGSALVGVLKDGEKGLQEFMQAADDAGGVIDEALIARAAELDKQFADAWRRFEINAKVAVLDAVTYLDDFVAAANRVANHPIFKQIAGWLPGSGAGDITYLDPDLARRHGQELGPDARIRDAFAEGLDSALAEADQSLVEALQKRYGRATEEAAKRTIIPGGEGDDEGGGRGKGRKSRNAAAEAALREAEAVVALIENLEHELSIVGKSGVERAKANALRQAGTAATEEQRQKIEELIEAIDRERDAMRSAEEASRFFQDAAEDAFSALVPAIETGNRALDRFLSTLIEAVMQATFLGTGPLAGLFGGGAGGGGGLFGGLLIPGILHSGGVAGKDGYGHGRAISPAAFAGAPRYHNGGIAGLRPDEVPAILQRGEVVLPRGADISAGVTVNFNPVIDNRGASVEAVARNERQLEQLKRELPSIVTASVRKAQKSNVKFGA